MEHIQHPDEDSPEDWEVWPDQASATRPLFKGTVRECETWYHENDKGALADLLFIEAPDGDQFAWNAHDQTWDEL